MTVTSTTTYRAQVVTEIQVQQIIVASGNDASAAQALRVLMMQSQMTGAAEMQALDFIAQFGGEAFGCGPGTPLSRTQALSTCRDNFDLLDTAAGIGDRDGIIGRADLQAILEAPGATPRLKAAARYLLDHFSELDDAAGNLGREDGKISMQDLDTGIAMTQMSDGRAIEIMRGNFDQLDTAGHGGCPDGIVSRDDLEGILEDSSATPELKAAARYALAHPELFDRIDTAGHGGDRDGKISRDDLDVSRESIGLDAPTAASNVLNFFGTIDDAAGNLGFNDNLIARCDLEEIVKNDSAPADVKAAARYLIDHPEVFDQIDTAWKGGDKDGLISPEDLRTWLGGVDPMGMCSPDPIDVLRGNFDRLDTAAHGGSGDGRVSREDLEAALNDPNTSEQLRSAIRFALDSQIFDQIDTAGYGGRTRTRPPTIWSEAYQF